MRTTLSVTCGDRDGVCPRDGLVSWHIRGGVGELAGCGLIEGDGAALGGGGGVRETVPVGVDRVEISDRTVGIELDGLLGIEVGNRCLVVERPVQSPHKAENGCQEGVLAWSTVVATRDRAEPEK